MSDISNEAVSVVISLEEAYNTYDIEKIIKLKDFNTEAKLILKEASYNYDINDANLIGETAELLKTALLQSLNENGFPNFKNVRREFSELEKIDNEIYFIQEKLFFPNDRIYSNKIFLSHIDNIWKVAMIVE